jgi:hypothetical protein
VLRIECPKCGRAGQYRLADLIMRYGRNEKVFTFIDDIARDCTRKRNPNDYDPCAAQSSDLPKVV